MQTGALAATDPLMGSLVRIKLNKVVYTGIVQRIERSGNPYVSIRVCSDGSSSKLSRPGKTMDFYGDELNRLELVVPEKDVPPGLKKPAAPRTLPSIPVTTPLHRAPASTAEDKEWEACRSSTYEPAHRPVSKAEWLQRLREEPARPIRPADNSHRPMAMDGDYTYIGELGEKFKSVVLTLAESATVGVMCQGKSVGRGGEASLAALSCRKGVYLFDLVAIGVDEAMEAGLKEILESSHVLKVVHDCRRLSDYLFHKLNISLVNVFDTQAADWMIRRAEAGGMVPIHVNSLRFCLQRYLQLYIQEVRFYETMNDALAEDEEVWMKRPIQPYLLDCACRSVHYLPELHGVMLQALLAEFVQAVDIYLGAMRDLPEDAPFENADVLPQLRHEFAINAGRRNFAAPGRATSPERDGLHHVPRCDTNPVRDREVLDRFFASHHNRYGDEPMTPTEAGAGSFPFRPLGSRVHTSDFDFPDSNAGSDAEFGDADECREPSVRFGDPLPPVQDPSAPVPGRGSPPVAVRRGPPVQDLGTDVDGPMPLASAHHSQGTARASAGHDRGSFSSSTPNDSSARFDAANKSAMPTALASSTSTTSVRSGMLASSIAAIGTSVDAPPSVARATSTPSSTQANRFVSTATASRGDAPSSADPRASKSADPRTSNSADLRTSSFADPRTSNSADLRTGNSADPCTNNYADPRTNNYADPRPNNSADPRTSNSAGVGMVPSSTDIDSRSRAAHARRPNASHTTGARKTTAHPPGVLPLSAMTHQPQAGAVQQVDAEGKPACEWRPNRAALDASWDNFTGREKTTPRAIIMGIGDSRHGSSGSSVAVDPVVSASSQLPPQLATSGRGSALRNASASVPPHGSGLAQGSGQGRGLGRGQMLAAVNAHLPGR